MKSYLLCTLAIVAMVALPIRTAAQELEYPRPAPRHFSGGLTAQFKNYSAGRYAACDEAGRGAGETALILAGLCKLELRNNEGALADFTSALKARSSSSDASFFRGIALQRLGRLPEAMSALDEALWFSKNRLVSVDDVRLARARLFKLMGQPEKAIEALKDYLKKNPDFVQAKIELGTLYLESGSRAESIAMLRQALVRTKLIEALMTRSEKGITQGEGAEAAAIASELLGDLKGKPRYEHHLFPFHVKGLIEAKDLTSAQKALDEAQAVLPQNAALQKLRERLRIEQQVSAMAASPVATKTAK
jgi:tetratricopeptide (TPR) repeat protein